MSKILTAYEVAYMMKLCFADFLELPESERPPMRQRGAVKVYYLEDVGKFLEENDENT